MTTTTRRRPAAGERVLFISPRVYMIPIRPPVEGGGYSVRDAVEVHRGSVVVLTAEMLAATRDRNGWTMFDLLHDSEAQQDRWGEIRFRHLPDDEDVPDYLRRPEPGSRAAQEEFDRRRLAILQEVGDVGERNRQLRALADEFGAPSSMSVVHRRGDSGDPEMDAPLDRWAGQR